MMNFEFRTPNSELRTPNDQQGDSFPMRITTWNVNGLRAAIRKGFAEHLAEVAPDVLLLQEVRSLPEQLPDDWAAPAGWHVHWHPAEKKGYAGTAVWSRLPMEVLAVGLEPGDADLEGRVIRARVAGIQIVCVYLPSGSSGDHRQAVKDAWMDRFLPWAETLTRSDEPVVIGGDLNIAHTPRDIFYAKSNENTSGFLPHERAWFGRLLDSGWSDFVRQRFGDIDGPYSWWSNRGQARKLDRGWRIDYLLGNAAAADRFTDASIHRDGGLIVSDHAPVTIELR
jgi:exodeoxyribonuclease-3